MSLQEETHFFLELRSLSPMIIFNTSLDIPNSNINFHNFVSHIIPLWFFYMVQDWNGVTRLTDLWCPWSVASLPCLQSFCCQDQPCFAVIGLYFRLFPHCPCCCYFPIGGELDKCCHQVYSSCLPITHNPLHTFQFTTKIWLKMSVLSSSF